jgi:hypothetical protein
VNWKQRGAVAKETPYAAQMKLLRLMRTAIRKVRNQDGSPLDRVEALAGFNEYGDLTSHFGVTLPTEPHHGVDLSVTPLNLEAIALMENFAIEMSKRGVTVLVSYTPVMREYYEAHRASIEKLHELLTQSPRLVVPSPPSEFALPRSLFFDTVYHPTEEGGELRTKLVLRDIERLRHGGVGSEPDLTSPARP